MTYTYVTDDILWYLFPNFDLKQFLEGDGGGVIASYLYTFFPTKKITVNSGHFYFFQTNTNIEILNLEGNAIDEDGAICLTKVLKENFFITELVSTCCGSRNGECLT